MASIILLSMHCLVLIYDMKHYLFSFHHEGLQVGILVSWPVARWLG